MELKKELENEFLTREQVAKLCHVTSTTIFRWDKAGTIKSYGIGIKALYKKEEIMNQIRAKIHLRAILARFPREVGGMVKQHRVALQTVVAASCECRIEAE